MPPIRPISPPRPNRAESLSVNRTLVHEGGRTRGRLPLGGNEDEMKGTSILFERRDLIDQQRGLRRRGKRIESGKKGIEGEVMEG